MKVIKSILLVLIALIALVLIVALFLPSEYEVSRSTEIGKSPELVYKSLNTFQNRTEWDPWAEMDPSSEAIITGPDSGVGASWAWKGKKTGEGNLTIMKVEENKHIESALVFTAPMAMESKVFWDLEATATGTKVKWTTSGELDYPMGKIYGLFIDGSLGPDLEKGLANLKGLLEK